MKPICTPFPPPVRSTVDCALVAFGSLRVTPEAIPSLRQTPAPGLEERVPASFLKHADEQTVVGLAAVYQAMSRHGLWDTPSSDWGVLAAPRFFGRAALVVALQRFALEGAWGVSPHLVPHRSLHSLSGTVSQALGIHGPNFGVGGGPRGAGEAMLVAAAMLSQGLVPAVWVVLTGWDPELLLERDGTPHRNGKPPPLPVCNAVALALTRPEAWDGATMAVAAGQIRRGGSRRFPAFSLESLQASLADPEARPMIWHVAEGGLVELR